jgi:uncharacterized SAM-binding protein YcdF (DUF218 family)
MLTLKMAAEPLVIAIFIMLAGELLRHKHKRLGRALLQTAFLFLYTLSTPLVGAYLLRSLELGAPSLPESSNATPQAIVVLGAGVRRDSPEYGEDTVGRLTLERIRYAARLHRRTHLPLLVSGGSLDPKVEPVSRTMASALMEDFLVSVRWVEFNSTNTYENALFSTAMLREQGVETIYLVTHAWHMTRAMEAFADAGLEVVPAATGRSTIDTGVNLADVIPNSRALLNSAYAIHEWVGRYWYRIAYYR